MTSLSIEGDCPYFLNLTSLIKLDLWGNQIRDISPLSNLTHLTELNLRGNQIRDISALVDNSGLDTGDVVLLEGNELVLYVSSEDMEDIRTLENRGVVVLSEMTSES